MYFAIRIFLSVLFFLYCSLFFVAYSQEMKSNHFMSLGEDVLEKGYFQLITNDSCRPDILLFSKKPSDTIKVSMPEMSTLIRTRIEALLINSLIPDIEFIEKNTLFYSVPAKSEKITITNSNRANPWQKGYDIAYLTYKVNELSFLLAFTGTHAWGSTYVYIKTTNKGESDKIDEDLLSKILTKEALDMIRFVEPGGPDDSVINFPPPIIPTYFISQTICLVRAVWFGNTATPSTDYRLNEWFSYSKKSIALQKESETKEMIRKKLITEWMEKCKNLILTGQGRAELIALIGSGHREAEFEGDVYRYKRFRELPYNALREYYSNYKDEKAEELARYSAWSPEKITPVEAEALRKLLQSDDKSVLEFALLLIEEGRGRSLVADLLKLQADQIVAPRLLLRRRGVPQRVYHFLVYKLLGKLGDGQTLKVLKERLKDDKNSEPVKADIELAVDDIQRHIVAHQRQKQAWLDLRRSVREKKVFTIGEIIDMDKPDPEPVSAEGFRNWETADGSFKTTAKFVSLKEIKNKSGKVINKEVHLLRQDGREVTIKYSLLRPVDDEYIRQQLEPFRDWSTVNGKLRINAKLLHKFDTEIILQESDGITTTVPTEQLSETDKEYLEQIPISPHSKYLF